MTGEEFEVLQKRIAQADALLDKVANLTQEISELGAEVKFSKYRAGKYKLVLDVTIRNP